MAAKKQTYKYPIVAIEWDDASSLDHGWVDPTEEKPTPQIVTTVGFLIYESESYLIIASTIDNTWVNSRFQIPVPMVKTRKVLFNGSNS